MGQIIITIAREFGSQGHGIADLLGEKLGIKVYDKNITDYLQEIGYDEEFIENYDEKKGGTLFAKTVHGMTNSYESVIAEKVFEYEKKLADSGESFIFVGRCASHVLKDNPNVIKIFVRGEHDFKKQHIMKDYNLSDAEAEDMMKTIDKRRRTYNNFYSDIKWGDSRGYDITINSSKLGIEKTADILYEYVKMYMK
ncbi:MAG: cytidylate kinase-like family protein [Oscillospiraceae bacterium]|nr:cytidylate kinase-like family protein [Oscillospiraceae bacterium]